MTCIFLAQLVESFGRNYKSTTKKNPKFAFNMKIPDMKRRATEESRECLVGLCLLIPCAELSVVGKQQALIIRTKPKLRRGSSIHEQAPYACSSL